MKKYRHELVRVKDIQTRFTSLEAMEQFTLDAMNEIGAKGGRLLGPPTEFNEPTTITDAAGRNLVNYGIMMFVEYEIPDEPPAA